MKKWLIPSWLTTSAAIAFTGLALLGMAFLLRPAPAEAQSEATAQVTVTIASFLEVTSDTDINFGGLTSDGTSDGTVIVRTDGTREAFPGAQLIGGGGGGPAIFVISGTAGDIYNIILPDLDRVVIQHDSGPTSLTLPLLGLFASTLSNPAPTPDGNVTTGTIGVDGTDTVFIGGELSVPNSTKTGKYQGDIPVLFTRQ